VFNDIQILQDLGAFRLDRLGGLQIKKRGTVILLSDRVPGPVKIILVNARILTAGRRGAKSQQNSRGTKTPDVVF